MEHNETAITVNPRNRDNIVASENDGQLTGQGNNLTFTAISRVRVSFDAGESWTTYAMPYGPSDTFTGDPSLAFDARGTVYLTTLASSDVANSDVVVFHSTDGGRSWSDPSRVALGVGNFGGAGVFNDHPVLTAWGGGNVLVTWIRYRSGPQGVLISAPMADVVSHDGGRTWTAPTIISGSSPKCVGVNGGHVCDQTWGNAPAASRNGTVLATFQQTTEYAPDGSTNLDRNSMFAVRLDPGTGQRIAGPFRIGLSFDGINQRDYPVSGDGRQTLQDSEFRLLSQGNLAADPTDPHHFAIVWFDDRNAPHPVAADPYQARTNADVIVSQTFDSGTRWSHPQALAVRNDQFMPWAAYDEAGRLRIGYFDRSYDPANHRYGYTLSSERDRGSLRFDSRQVTTTLSNPTRDNFWSSDTVDPSFPNTSFFVGDYSAVAARGDGVVAFWTDLRRRVCFGPPINFCGHGQDVFFATMK